MRFWALVFAGLVASRAGAAEIQVRVNGGLVDVQATAAPLQDVLARIAQQTGMKVVYDGPPPRGLVTVTLPQRTPAEAVLSLLEGTGVNYAMKTDRSGMRIDTLIVMSAAGGATGSASAAVRPSVPPPSANDPRRVQPPERAEDREEDEKDEPDEKARPQPPVPGGGAPVTFSGVVPGPGRPGSPFGNQMGPLTMPTPPPPAASPAPGPAPTPSPTPNPGTP